MPPPSRLPVEAGRELEEIAPKLRIHPAVLEVRWQIYSNLKKREGALDIASGFVKLVPDWSSGWVYRIRKLTRR